VVYFVLGPTNIQQGVAGSVVAKATVNGAHTNMTIPLVNSLPERLAAVDSPSRMAAWVASVGMGTP